MRRVGKVEIMNFKVLTKDEMEGLTTSRLLAYRKSLLRCHSQQDWGETIKGLRKFTKETLEWDEVYGELKGILATREHIERNG